MRHLREASAGGVLVTKHRVNDTGSAAGIATSGALFSTVRHAVDTDHRRVVVGTAAATGIPNVHGVVAEKV